MNIDALITDYLNNGYSLMNARSTVCHDIILSKIFKSNFKKNITIKGGVVMHKLSNSMRRATQDLDMDFIKYSLSDEAINEFINRLNTVNDGIKIEIIGKIEKLSHQDYSGKRVQIILKDNYGSVLENKLDLGVHKNFDLEQDEYYFDFDNDCVNLLINSKEQIFTEKMKSLLKFGIRSSRYKDLFDFYYLINVENINKEKLIKCFNSLIFNEKTMKEKNFEDVYQRLYSIFNSKIYRTNLANPKYNWLDVSVQDAISSVLVYIKNLYKIQNKSSNFSIPIE